MGPRQLTLGPGSKKKHRPLVIEKGRAANVQGARVPCQCHRLTAPVPPLPAVARKGGRRRATAVCVSHYIIPQKHRTRSNCPGSLQRVGA